MATLPTWTNGRTNFPTRQPKNIIPLPTLLAGKGIQVLFYVAFDIIHYTSFLRLPSWPWCISGDQNNLSQLVQLPYVKTSLEMDRV